MKYADRKRENLRNETRPHRTVRAARSHKTVIKNERLQKQSNELSKFSPDEDPIHVGRLEQNTQQGYNHWDITPKRAGTRSTEI